MPQRLTRAAALVAVWVPAGAFLCFAPLAQSIFDVWHCAMT